jgi:hypothetical protein
LTSGAGLASIAPFRMNSNSASHMSARAAFDDDVIVDPQVLHPRSIERHHSAGSVLGLF